MIVLEWVQFLKPNLLSSQMINDDDDDESSDDDDEDASDMMMVDELKPNYVPTDEMKSIPKQIVDGDGWSVVSSRKNKGKKTGWWSWRLHHLFEMTKFCSRIKFHHLSVYFSLIFFCASVDCEAGYFSDL